MVTPAEMAPPPQISFDAGSAEAVPYAAVPTLRWALRIQGPAETEIRSVVLDTQVRLAAPRRGHDPVAQPALVELFGDASRWGETVTSLLWTQVTSQVPSFRGETTFDLLVPCTYDFEVTASKYLHALGDDGDVPLDLLFSGTVFYLDGGQLRMARLPHDRDAETAMPVAVWREVMDHYFPNSAWLRTGRDTFDRLYAYRARRGLPSWDATLDALLGDFELREGSRSWTG